MLAAADMGMHHGLASPSCVQWRQACAYVGGKPDSAERTTRLQRAALREIDRSAAVCTPAGGCPQKARRPRCHPACHSARTQRHSGGNTRFQSLHLLLFADCMKMVACWGLSSDRTVPRMTSRLPASRSARIECCCAAILTCANASLTRRCSACSPAIKSCGSICKPRCQCGECGAGCCVDLPICTSSSKNLPGLRLRLRHTILRRQTSRRLF